MSGNSLFIRIAGASAALTASPLVVAGALAPALFTSTTAATTATQRQRFSTTSHAEDLNTPDECMVWSGTAYRSLEINTNGKVSEGRSAVWSTDNAIAGDQDRGCLHSV